MIEEEEAVVEEEEAVDEEEEAVEDEEEEAVVEPALNGFGKAWLVPANGMQIIRHYNWTQLFSYLPIVDAFILASAPSKAPCKCCR